MILSFLYITLVIAFGEASNVIPHIPYTPPGTKIPTPLTLRDSIQPGTFVRIEGQYVQHQRNDLTLYVIAGGDGQYNDKLKAVVLEIRVYHGEDRISYGSLSHLGAEMEYGPESKNPIGSSFDFVLEFKDTDIVIWVLGKVLAVHSIKTTIQDMSEISGIYMPQNDEVEIWPPVHIPPTSFGSWPYSAKFDPPISNDKPGFLEAFSMVNCSGHYKRDMQYVFRNSTDHPLLNYHFMLSYSCRDEMFTIQGNNAADYKEKKYGASKIKQGLVLRVAVVSGVVEVAVGEGPGDESATLFNFPLTTDIGKYPITDLFIIGNANFTLSMLVMQPI